LIIKTAVWRERKAHGYLSLLGKFGKLSWRKLKKAKAKAKPKKDRSPCVAGQLSAADAKRRAMNSTKDK
jgi:hypothetical protein